VGLEETPQQRLRSIENSINFNPAESNERKKH